MTRVLITGANGFVGRQIIRSLDMKDIDLIPIVREGKESTFLTLKMLRKL